MVHTCVYIHAYMYTYAYTHKWWCYEIVLESLMHKIVSYCATLSELYFFHSILCFNGPFIFIKYISDVNFKCYTLFYIMTMPHFIHNFLTDKHFLNVWLLEICCSEPPCNFLVKESSGDRPLEMRLSVDLLFSINNSSYKYFVVWRNN